MVYQWKEGSRFPLKAQVAGEEIARLTERNGGYLAPSDVVDAARPDGSPLHPAFPWDDAEAAEMLRVEVARRLIRSVRVVVMDGDRERPVLGYIHVDLPETGPAYVTTARAVSDAELRRAIIDEALAQLRAWERRHAHIVELAPVLQAVAEALRVLRRRKQAGGKQARGKRAGAVAT